jgi:hypothetical protein
MRGSTKVAMSKSTMVWTLWTCAMLIVGVPITIWGYTHPNTIPFWVACGVAVGYVLFVFFGTIFVAVYLASKRESAKTKTQ